MVSVLLLVAAACGGNGGPPAEDDGAAQDTTDTTDTADDGAPEDDVAAGESYSWQYASYLPPQSGLMIAIENYFDDLESGADVQIETFYQESLLAATDILGGVRDQRAQLGFTIALYHPGELPLSQIVGVPFVTEDAEAQVRTFNEMYETHEPFRSEWEDRGVHVLTFTPLSNSIVATTEEVTGLDDLSGRSIRSVGFLAGAMDAVGVNPVAMPAPEIFESLERGVIDGFSSYPFDVAVANNLHEAAPFFIEPGTGLYNLGALIISSQVWDDLPEDMQAMMTDLVDDYLEGALDILSQEDSDRCDQLLEEGGTAVELSDADVQSWQQEVGDSVADRWREDAVSAGVSEEDVDGFNETYRSTLADFEAQSSYTPGLRECAQRAG
jgi:TRAP-type C4-dicarboxylate transport system substrate-binding protein